LVVAKDNFRTFTNGFLISNNVRTHIYSLPKNLELNETLTQCHA